MLDLSEVLYILSGSGKLKHKEVCVSLREENLNVNQGVNTVRVKTEEGQFIIVAIEGGLLLYIAHLKASSLEEAKLKLQMMKEKGGLPRRAHRIRDSLKVFPNPNPNRPAEDFKFLEILSISVD